MGSPRRHKQPFYRLYHFRYLADMFIGGTTAATNDIQQMVLYQRPKVGLQLRWRLAIAALAVGLACIGIDTDTIAGTGGQGLYHGYHGRYFRQTVDAYREDMVGKGWVVSRQTNDEIGDMLSQQVDAFW